MDEEPKIKPQYKLVAKYYCGECHGNAEQSLIKAGYSKAYARGNAYKVVAREDVQQYIKWLNDRAAEYAEVASIHEIHAFWTFVMYDDRECMRDRLKASEYLAKAKGMFNTDW